jgi:hypothetical protein
MTTLCLCVGGGRKRGKITKYKIYVETQKVNFLFKKRGWATALRVGLMAVGFLSRFRENVLAVVASFVISDRLIGVLL